MGHDIEIVFASRGHKKTVHLHWSAYDHEVLFFYHVWGALRHYIITNGDGEVTVGRADFPDVLARFERLPRGLGVSKMGFACGVPDADVPGKHNYFAFDGYYPCPSCKLVWEPDRAGGDDPGRGLGGGYAKICDSVQAARRLFDEQPALDGGVEQVLKEIEAQRCPGGPLGAIAKQFLIEDDASVVIEFS
mmetsp:Transcript_104167/g.335927  ORF Transcript_104167/g.335927 Transcript_104167/m.335927 type:complete len:190 (+) Transcript_104167:119-688(+)